MMYQTLLESSVGENSHAIWLNAKLASRHIGHTITVRSSFVVGWQSRKRRFVYAWLDIFLGRDARCTISIPDTYIHLYVLHGMLSKDLRKRTITYLKEMWSAL